MPWLPESRVAPDTVAFVHQYLLVLRNTKIGITCVMDLTDILKAWVAKEWEPKLKQKALSLTDMCIPGTISTMAAAVEQLNTLEDSLPARRSICRDQGIIRDGAREPYPEINTWELPEPTQVRNIFQQIATVFEWLLSVMKLIRDAVQDAFWDEVARAQNSTTDHVKEIWSDAQDNLTSALTDIRNFAAAGHAGAQHPQTPPLAPAAQCKLLLARLRACTLN